VLVECGPLPISQLADVGPGEIAIEGRDRRRFDGRVGKLVAFGLVAWFTWVGAARHAWADDRPRDAQRIDDYCRLYGHGDPATPCAGMPLRHLIALAPDPIDASRMGSFDTVLEALEEAVDVGTSVRYVRDSRWLPWPPPAGSAKAEDEYWKDHPGVLIYRPVGDIAIEPTYLVFVVG
jgi:hypothetical protein